MLNATLSQTVSGFIFGIPNFVDWMKMTFVGFKICVCSKFVH